MNIITHVCALVAISLCLTSCGQQTGLPDRHRRPQSTTESAKQKEATTLLDLVDRGNGLSSSEVDRCIKLLQDEDPLVRFSVGLALSRGARSDDRGRAVEALIVLLKSEPYSYIDGGTVSFILQLNPNILPRIEAEMSEVKKSNPIGYSNFKRLLPYYKKGAHNLREGRPFADHNPFPQ